MRRKPFFHSIRVALYAWDGEGTSGEAGGYLLFPTGAPIEVIQDGAPGDWWKGRIGGVTGWFPSAFTCETDMRIPDLREMQLTNPGGVEQMFGETHMGGHEHPYAA